ncbi:MAG: succinate dehydrogenase assembly factor 2 [Betaproteobacteria bacterium]|jgi:antitoxin CptB
MAELDKVRWHCRRGLLELDIILERFNRQHLAVLAPGQLEQFKELLALDDNHLLDLILGREVLEEERLHSMLQLLQAA